MYGNYIGRNRKLANLSTDFYKYYSCIILCSQPALTLLGINILSKTLVTSTKDGTSLILGKTQPHQFAAMPSGRKLSGPSGSPPGGIPGRSSTVSAALPHRWTRILASTFQHGPTPRRHSVLSLQKVSSSTSVDPLRVAWQRREQPPPPTPA
jgi:hypothetical protein